MSKIFLRLLIAIIIIMLGVTVWDIYKNKSNGSSIEEKVAVEIDFLDENITDIINYLNNITINMYQVNKIESEAQDQGTGQSQSSGSQSSSGSSGEKQSSGGGSTSGSGQGGESQGSSSGQEQAQSQGNGETGQASSKQEVVQYQIEKNNILNTEREVTNWEQIKNDIEKLYTSFITIEIDLEEVGVEKAEILGFSKLLDDTIISIKNEDKQNSINNLSNLYKYIPKFYPNNDEKKYVYQTKAEIIEAYSLLEDDKWEQISNKISSAQEKFSNSVEKSSKKITTNKVNLLLKDLKEGIKLQDKDVFYIKYKNILDELKNLC